MDGEGPLQTVWRCGLYNFFKGVYLFSIGCDFRILGPRLKGVCI